MTPLFLQQHLHQAGDQLGVEQRAGAGGAGGHLDGLAPDLDPPVALVQQLDAEQFGAAVRLDEEGEAGVRQAGVAAVFLFDLRPGQAEDPGERTVVHPRAHVAEDRAGLGQEPAGDPRLAAGERPVAGRFHVEDVGGVLVHSGEIKRRTLVTRLSVQQAETVARAGNRFWVGWPGCRPGFIPDALRSPVWVDALIFPCSR